jgi:hypothetical protein
MQRSGDPSILHRLARSFGQGLAFGVGVTFTQRVVRSKNNADVPAVEPDPAAVRVGDEPGLQAVDRSHAAQPRVDQRAVLAIVTVIEKRLREQSAETRRQLAELEATLGASVLASMSEHVEAENAALRSQLVTMHRDFAEAVARIVAEQVAAQVADRTAALEAGVQQSIEAAVAPLRSEIHELRQRLAETENTVADFEGAISETVRKATQRVESSKAQPEPPAAKLPSPRVIGAGQLFHEEFEEAPAVDRNSQPRHLDTHDPASPDQRGRPEERGHAFPRGALSGRVLF